MKGFLLGSCVLLTIGCRTREPPSPHLAAADSMPAADTAPIGPAEEAAYALGRRREIGAMESALAHGGTIAEPRLDSIGAAAAGLGVAEYLRLVARVDGILRSAGSGSGGSSTARHHPALDSLRIARMVLAVRLQP